MNPEAKKTLRRLIIAVPLMFAFGFALVPLYDVFCEVTGINGKVFQSENAEKLLTDQGRPLGLQFISTNNENMPWTFEPSEEVMTISTGQYYTATFYVKNTTDKKMTAQAVPSVAPSNAAAHLKKLECFCFTRRRKMYWTLCKPVWNCMTLLVITSLNKSWISCLQRKGLNS